MKEEIYRNVAMPATFLWAPQIIAIMNLTLQMTVMFMVFAIFKVNFLWFFISILAGHFVAASYGMREPHVDKMLMSLGKVPMSSTNMYRSKGVKLGS